MNIDPREITIRDLVNGYVDNGESGVKAYDGKLDVRPPYQREFVYSEKQQKSVIDTVLNGYPLNTMYWAVRNDGTFEVIDGQQRTLSICRYVHGDFSVVWKGETKYFESFLPDMQETILNYALTVYACRGTDTERLAWFRTINIAGEELTDQELRNAVYAGPWTADAKRYFSKSNCPAYSLAKDYMQGSPIRQDYLETAIRWFANGDIEEYMARHQHDPSASDLWVYFQNVIAWVKTLFPKYRKEMKTPQWGALYNEFKGNSYNPAAMEKEVKKLMADDDVQKKSGVYEYLLSGRTRENALNIRAFTESQRRAAYEKQAGICPKCGKHFNIEEMDADHITPWSKGGPTTADNCQMLCKADNRRKGAR